MLPRDQPLRFLILTGSRRAESLNARLAQLAATVLAAKGCTVDSASVRDFEVPVYDGDAEAATGVPDQAQRFRARLTEAHALIIASPEYNASLPGGLKNLLDWVSRTTPQPLHEKQCLLMSASPSMMGGNRGLWALRVPLEHLGARVYPDMFSLAQAHTAFDENGQLADRTLSARFADNLGNFQDLVESAILYPCVKRAWVEYLGEPPDPRIDRVEVS